MAAPVIANKMHDGTKMEKSDVVQQPAKGLRGLEAGREAYRQALLDQLGLTLVPTNMPVEMLVVKQAQ
jgi:hypothetical protein